MELLARVRRFVREHDLIRPATRVVAAVSGGSDSVALAWILRQLHNSHELRLVGIVHFNHQLRATADRDERHVAALASALHLPLLAEREDVRMRAAAEHRSIEDAARTARHACFRRALQHFAADAVALGHTQDDQAETFLLRLVRGAGPRGLSAMHPRNDFIVRPLLECGRDELRAFLRDASDRGAAAAWVDDESNADTSIPRNRVRAELMPLLAARFNPSIVRTLAREAELSREIGEWLDDRVNAAWRGAVRCDGAAHSIDCATLATFEPPVRRALVWRALEEVAGHGAIGYDHVADALRAADENGPAAIDLPGVRVQRVAGTLVLTDRHSEARDAGANLFRYPLSIPGEVRSPDMGWVVAAEPLDGRSAGLAACATAGNGPVACVRVSADAGPLAVRNRRPGDRFRPAGGPGWRKLQDFFVDRKIAQRERDCVPLVVDRDDRIIWVAGHRIDEAFRAAEGSDHVLLLTLKALGGSA